MKEQGSRKEVLGGIKLIKYFKYGLFNYILSMTLQIEYVSFFIISNKTIIRSNNESHWLSPNSKREFERPLTLLSR